MVKAGRPRRSFLWLLLLLASTSVAGGDAAAAVTLRLGARLLVSEIDRGLEATAKSVLDELELKTFVVVVREAAGGFALRSSDFGGAAGQGSLRRRVAAALLAALGVRPSAEDQVDLAASVAAGTPAGVFSSLEVAAVNALCSRVLLTTGRPPLPQAIEVGLWMLAGADWEDMLDGRGRRVVSGAARIAQQLSAALPTLGLVGALPSFVFHGNKAEVVLLGLESAQLHTRGMLPAFGASSGADGLGSGIRRASEFARSAFPVGSFTGAVPTLLGDGSLLLLRAAAFRIVRGKTSFGQGSSDALKNHRSALAWARTSAWAKDRGAFMGLPSFMDLPAEISDNTLEVLMLYTPLPGANLPPDVAAAAAMAPIAARGQGFALGQAIALLWTCFCCMFFLWRQQQKMRRSNFFSQAERDLERLVANL